MLAAALLHDVGKTVSGPRHLRPGDRHALGRAWAAATRPRRGARPGASPATSGLYLRHPELGADQLALAGSDPLTVAWAREHHLPAERWTVPADLGEILKTADDD